MKDEFDDVTPDMFERGPNTKVSKISGTTYVTDQTHGEKAAGNKPEKLPAKETAKLPPRTGGGGGGGNALEKGMMGSRFKPTLHAKGGKISSKVAGRLATRGYGIAKK